jgi:sirohydrochlorin ferrochelatase
MSEAVASPRLSIAPLLALSGRHTAKQISRWFGCAVSTAKVWLVDGAPAERRAELADVIDAQVAEVLKHIEEARAYATLLRRPT